MKRELRMMGKKSMEVMLMIPVSAGAIVLMRSGRSYDKFFEEFKGRNLVRNDCGTVNLLAIGVKQDMPSYIMTSP